MSEGRMKTLEQMARNGRSHEALIGTTMAAMGWSDGRALAVAVTYIALQNDPVAFAQFLQQVVDAEVRLEVEREAE